MKCLNCSNEFKPKRSTAKYCSDACKLIYNRGRMEEMKGVKVALEKSLTPLTKKERLQMFQDMMPKTEWVKSGTELDKVTLLPKNKITLIYGKPGIGKSTTANRIAAIYPGKTLYIDTEAGLSPERLEELGVDPRTFTVKRIGMMEDVYDLLMAPETLKYDLIIWDSVAGTSFRSEIEGSAFDRQMGVKAIIMNKLMRILPLKLEESGTTLLLINQVQQGFGLYAENTPPGGKGQRHAAGIVISLTGTYPNVTVELKKNRFGDVKKEKVKL